MLMIYILCVIEVFLIVEMFLIIKLFLSSRSLLQTRYDTTSEKLRELRSMQQVNAEALYGLVKEVNELNNMIKQSKK